MNEINKLYIRAFTNWMTEHHLWVLLLVGFSKIAIVIAFVVSILLSWWFAWWWKLTLTIVAIGIVGKWIVEMIMEHYLEKFKNKNQ